MFWTGTYLVNFSNSKDMFVWCGINICQYVTLQNVAVFIGVWLYFHIFSPRKTIKINPAQNIVAITGCDSGFGLGVAQKLSAQGYKVVAGCLTQEGVARLNGVVALAIQCDVTKNSDITAFAEAIERYADETGTRLWAVVNNAGIPPGGLIDYISESTHRRVFEVNYFGTVAVIKELLHLLKKTKNSRIINVSSAAGIAGLPGGGPYCGSKHAIEGMAKCLRQELAPWNIYVANINPGFMNTPLLELAEKIAMKEFENAPKHLRDQYSVRNVTNLNEFVVKIMEDPKLVIDAIVANVTYAKPLLFNPVGVQAKVISFFFKFIPQYFTHCLEDWMNNSVEYGPTREAVATIQVNK